MMENSKADRCTACFTFHCLVRVCVCVCVFNRYQAVLAESVFAHMLQLPSPQFAPLYYSGVISDLCVKMERFPQ